MRFSITHSKSGALISTGNGVGQRFTVSRMREEMRVCIYEAARPTTVLRSSVSICGREPIFENREAIIDRRFTSFSISPTISRSTPISLRSCVHAISEDMGVPSWWAVSFDRPTHTLFCSALRVEFTA